MTLLEMTVCILVLLGLIGVLMMGTVAWKEGSDRSACVMNIRNTQNAVRAYQNIRDLKDGTTFNMAVDIIGPGGYMQIIPQCPGGGNYSYLSYIPNPGELVLTCDLAATRDHEPKDYADW